MIGRIGNVRTQRNHAEASPDDLERELSDYTCPICSGTSYRLVFSVSALTQRVSLVVRCNRCSLPKDVPDGDAAEQDSLDVTGESPEGTLSSP